MKILEKINKIILSLLIVFLEVYFVDSCRKSLFNEIKEAFSEGKPGLGVLYICCLVFIVAGIVLMIVLLIDSRKKERAQKQKELDRIKDLRNTRNYWCEIKAEADRNSFSAAELYGYLIKIFEDNKYDSFKEESKNGLKIFRARTLKNEHYVLLSLEKNEINFNKLADIVEVAKEESEKNDRVFFVDHYSRKNMYIRLMTKIFYDLDILFFTNQWLSREAGYIIKRLNSEITIKENKLKQEKEQEEAVKSKKNTNKKQKQSSDDFDEFLDDMIFLDIMDDF